MRAFQEPESDSGRNALTFALGAIGGLALGMMLYRRASPEKFERVTSGIRDRARTVARRLRPARMQRMAVEQEELTLLEDRVLDAFLADGMLSERGVDVGAISEGIIELSGSVWTEEEADRAVHLANSVRGVRTVVNRLDVETEARYRERHRQQIEDDEGVEGTEWTGRMVGMSRRRQGRQTEKRETSDGQEQRTEALRDADLAQYEDEDIAHEQPRVGARPGTGDPWQLNYDEDEVVPQDPHGKHAKYTLDSPPQELNTAARVGEPMKPGERLTLEQSDVPMKPRHGASGGNEDTSAGSN
jgi:hypothetical protein